MSPPTFRALTLTIYVCLATSSILVIFSMSSMLLWFKVLLLTLIWSLCFSNAINFSFKCFIFSHSLSSFTLITFTSFFLITRYVSIALTRLPFPSTLVISYALASWIFIIIYFFLALHISQFCASALLKPGQIYLDNIQRFLDSH
jgi:hypothetical protein